MIFVPRYWVGGGVKWRKWISSQLRTCRNDFTTSAQGGSGITPFSLSKMLLQEKTTFPRGKSLKYILHLSEKNKNFPKIQKRSQKSQKNLKENPMNPKNPQKNLKILQNTNCKKKKMKSKVPLQILKKIKKPKKNSNNLKPPFEF